MRPDISPAEPAARRRVLPAAQCATGALLLGRPGPVGRALGGVRSAPAQWLVRMLGARLVVQGGAALVRPTRAVLLASAAVDATHATSMFAVAALSPRYRRVALISAAAATASAVVSAPREPFSAVSR
jgi:hypothetical protein